MYNRKKQGVTNRNGYTLIDKQDTKKEGIKIMTNQEIFEILADNEEKLFYALCHNKENEMLKTAYKNARQSLEAFALATGCHN